MSSSSELSVLYEIASLPFETTESKICELVMDKLIRVFLANRCAIIKLSNKQPVRNFTYGFKKGINVYEIIQKKGNDVFKYSLTNGILFAEKKVPFTNIQIKYLIILADRLNESLLMLEAKRLKQETKDINTIFKTIPDPLIIIDEQHRILEVNQKTIDMTHFSKKEVLSTIFHERKEISPESRQAIKEERFLDPKNPIEIYTTLNNRLMCLEINATKVKFKGKKAYLLIFRDVTKRKEIDRLKSEFISLTSHQLRTPSSGIKWLCELLIKGRVGKLKPEQYELVGDINEFNMRMIKLIDDLLNVSIIKSKKTKLFKTKFPVRPLIREVIKEKIKFANKKKIEINLITKLKDIKVFADREKIRQVFENLFDNVIKYSEKNPQIDIGWEISNKHEVEFKISDNGIGIPKNEQGEVFNAFFRAKNAAKLDVTRSGLGLYVVKTIITALNGRIWFKSEVGKGTTFYFTLPKG
jgi:PAS domain S-box-containing protein